MKKTTANDNDGPNLQVSVRINRRLAQRIDDCRRFVELLPESAILGEVDKSAVMRVALKRGLDSIEAEGRQLAKEAQPNRAVLMLDNSEA